MVQHGEIEAVHLGDVLQLAAGDVACARPLDLDHIGPEPGQKLRAGRPGLDMGEIKDFHAIKGFGVLRGMGHADLSLKRNVFCCCGSRHLMSSLCAH